MQLRGAASTATRFVQTINAAIDVVLGRAAWAERAAAKMAMMLPAGSYV